MTRENTIYQDISVVVHKKPACRVELEVKAPSLLVSDARRDAIKKINKEVLLPGFRKGRAPEEIIVKKYASAVEDQWRKSIADIAFVAAQRQVRVFPLNAEARISYDLKSHSLDTGAELLFSFEVEPEIPSIRPESFHITRTEPQKISDTQIDEAIYQMKFYYAKWQPILDRGAQEGDYVTIDLDTLEDEPPKRVFSEVRFEVSQKRMAQWMQKLILGAKIGDVLEGISEPDPDATESMAPKKVRITLRKVEEAVLPDAEEFVHNIMKVENADVMRDSIRKILQGSLDEKALSALREQASEYLVDQYVFELPLSLIEAEKNHRKMQMMKDPDSRKSLEKLSSEEKKKFEEKLYTDASKAIRLFYLSRHIVREAKIPISHEEVQEEATRAVGIFEKPVDPEKLPKEAFALALSRIMLRKAQDHLIAGASPSQIEVEKPEADKISTEKST